MCHNYLGGYVSRFEALGYVSIETIIPYVANHTLMNPSCNLDIPHEHVLPKQDTMLQKPCATRRDEGDTWMLPEECLEGHGARRYLSQVSFLRVHNHSYAVSLEEYGYSALPHEIP